MSKNKKQQVVLIMTDTQRKDMLGCYGKNDDMKTPNLDALANEGIRFDKAYTAQPVCGPARSALFTGQFPHSNGSWGNSMPLGEGTMSIGERLTNQSVPAAYIGKWHLDGGDYFGKGQCPKGWDEDYWYDMRNYLEELTDEERTNSRKYDSVNIEASFTYGHRCSNRAIEYIDKNEDEDFLLVVSYDEPHGPFLCPDEYIDMYREYDWPKSINAEDDLLSKPEHQQVWSQEYKMYKEYLPKSFYNKFLSCNSFVDDEIGRVLDKIKEKIPDALVIYTTDHGDMMGSHNMLNKGAVMYDEITNIPLLIKCKGLIEEGEVNDHPVSHVDIVPTIMDYFALEQSKLFDGRSLMPTLTEDVQVNEQIFMEFGRYEVDLDGFGGFQPIRCVYDGRFKLVINLMTSDELYDTSTDTGELINLINSDEHKCKRDELHDRLLLWMNDTRDPFRGYYWERRPWRVDSTDATWAYTGMTRQREAEHEPKQLDYDTGLEFDVAVRKK